LNNEDLLRPTLSEYRQPPAIYSSTGFFLSAFFGGPLGVAIYGACNSRRLGRLAVDLPVILALVVGVYFLAYVFVRGGQIASLAEIMAGSPEWTTELTLRAFALACYGAIYLRHRRFFPRRPGFGRETTHQLGAGNRGGRAGLSRKPRFHPGICRAS
jgi:hypothetical protein